MGSRTSLLEIQEAVKDKLRNDVILMSLINGVFDDVPKTLKMPYIQIGEATEVPFNTFNRFGKEATITIHIWSEYRGLKELLKIFDRVNMLLDFEELPMKNFVQVVLQLENSETVRDGDGIRKQIPARYRVISQQKLGIELSSSILAIGNVIGNLEVIASDSLFTDFSEFVVDEQPNTWTRQWEIASWLVRELIGAIGDRALEFSNLSNRRFAISWDDVGILADTNSYMRFQHTSNIGAFPGFSINSRISGSAGNESGYVFGQGGSDTVRITKYVNGNATTIDSIPFSFILGQFYHLRFELIGQVLRGKVWADGDVEPIPWMIEVNDSDLTIGLQGIFNFSGGSRFVDTFEIISLD